MAAGISGMAAVTTAGRGTGRSRAWRMRQIAAGRGRIPIVAWIVIIIHGAGPVVVVGIIVADIDVATTPVAFKPEIEDRGIIQGHPLARVKERHKQILFDGNVTFLADDNPDHAAGDAFP